MASMQEIEDILPSDPSTALDTSQMADILNDKTGKSNYSKRLRGLLKYRAVTFRDVPGESGHMRRVWWKVA